MKPPNEADLFLLGRTDTGVPPAPGTPSAAPQPVVVPPPPPPAANGGAAGGMASREPIGLEKEYGHVF